MEKKICTLEIVIDGVPYFYEAHSYQRVAEILSSQLETLDSYNKSFGKSSTIDNFVVHYFEHANA